MDNAKKQHQEWANKYQTLFAIGEKYGVPVPYGHWDAVAIRVITDQKLKIEAYGDKAFAASEKQAEIVQDFFKRWEAAIAEARNTQLSQAVNEIVGSSYTALTIDAGHQEYIPFEIAKRYLRGDFDLSEAKARYNAELLEQDIKSCKEENDWWDKYNYLVRLSNS